MTPALLGQAWQHRALILFAALAFMTAYAKRQGETAAALRAELAAKPRVDEKLDKKVESRVERGPSKVTEKFAVAGDCKPVVVERIVESAPIVETRTVEVERVHSEAPACPAKREPRWITGVSMSPLDPRQVPIVRAGYSLGGRLDLTYGYAARGVGGQQHLVEAAWRW